MKAKSLVWFYNFLRFILWNDYKRYRLTTLAYPNCHDIALVTLRSTTSQGSFTFFTNIHYFFFFFLSLRFPDLDQISRIIGALGLKFLETICSKIQSAVSAVIGSAASV